MPKYLLASAFLLGCQITGKISFDSEQAIACGFFLRKKFTPLLYHISTAKASYFKKIAEFYTKYPF
jgi:hypothetical protein